MFSKPILVAGATGYVGGRLIPGRYPEPPRSRLLRNDAGRFADVTQALAPDLVEVGMVTGALWSDVNRDGRVDLLLTLEWGPVKLFSNKEGALVDETASAGLDGRLGWWNSITGADLDRDGDIDYIVTNTGLNTKYGAPSESSPILLFDADLKDAGGKRLIEARLEGNRLVPIRSRACAVRAVPQVKASCPTFRHYAAADIYEIYGKEALRTARKLTTTCLETGVLCNVSTGGRARLEWRPLPRAGQLSPGHGAAVTDLDGDGRVEIHVVQNFFPREPRTGPWCGGHGVTVQVDDAGRLETLSNGTTGLMVPGDARGLTVCDLDGDGWPDLAATQNDDRLLAFRNRGDHGSAPLVVSLQGPKGNPTGVGARVTVVYQDGRLRAAEVYAGSGYLSQTTASLYFARRPNPIREVRTSWPDGTETVTQVESATTRVTVAHPRE